MTGGFSRPKKDRMLKVSDGQSVKTGQLLARGMPHYKAGENVSGLSNMHALCNGKLYFSKKKTSHGQVRTFLNVRPQVEKAS